MKRRHFLKYSSLGIASSIITACGQGSSSNRDRNQPTDINFGTLEKPNLILGYVPAIDAATLIIAKEKGFFARYGLTVELRRQTNWEELEKGLLEWRLDGIQALYGMPIATHFSSNPAAISALMVLNLNGSAIALSPKVWQAGIRPSVNYANFQEFADNFRNYIRRYEQPPSLGTESTASMDTYLLRYWLAAMGIDPTREVKFSEFEPSQLIYKLQAGTINGYCVSDPWTQDAVWNKAGFVAYVSRDLWTGHPGKILATMQGWVDKNPTTAKALVASLLEACEYCDRPENYAELAQILAQSQYLNTSVLAIEPSLSGKYNYTQLDGENQTVSIPDLTIFHDKKTDYLKNNHANYPWRSHAVWMLTQMIRWDAIDVREYPQDADKILDKLYPTKIYEEVAKALKMQLPSDKMKKEATTAFIDRREFDPSQPVAYLNQFEMRATKATKFYFI
jgi:nitrate/nitrite transport system substrate-binding protein